ncbi:MAG: electron transporter, partial [Micromonosporaceae bacterium]|nr:electron transporter [Micromonosporaceae bacterium]
MTPRARIIAALVSVAAVVGAAGLYWFAPWRLFTDRTVNETLPTFVSPATPEASSRATDSTTPTGP